MQMYLPDDYVECLKNRTIVLDEKQFDLVERRACGYCLDLGANIGHETLLMARKAEQVYAFEPEPNNFEILKANVELNDLKNVELHQKAVSDFNGKIELYLCGFNNGMHRVYPSKYCNDKIKVEAVMIDDIVERVNFVKMDLEGAELPALFGMQDLLSNYKPVIMLEFHPPSIEEAGDVPEVLYNFLKGLGYERFELMDGTIVKSFRTLNAVCSYNSAENVICWPY